MVVNTINEGVYLTNYKIYQTINERVYRFKLKFVTKIGTFDTWFQRLQKQPPILIQKINVVCFKFWNIRNKQVVKYQVEISTNRGNFYVWSRYSELLKLHQQLKQSNGELTYIYTFFF